MRSCAQNTIKGDSFIPYPGCSLLGHTACAVDSSSLVIFGGSLETTAGFDCVNTFWDVATDAKQKLHQSQLPKPTGQGVYNTTFKLLVVGDAGVGKTCLITRFVDDVFSSTCKSTIGVRAASDLTTLLPSGLLGVATHVAQSLTVSLQVDFKAHSIEMDGKQVQLQVWDTAGQERFRALTTSYYRGAHGVILVYDVNEQSSYEVRGPRASYSYALRPLSASLFSPGPPPPLPPVTTCVWSGVFYVCARQHLASWIKDVDLYSGEEVVKLLIGNKDDQPDRKTVDASVAREFAKDHNMLFMEASAMSGVHVNAAFKLLVAEVMHQADTVASQPPAFEHKLKVNAERSRRAANNCSGANCKL